MSETDDVVHEARKALLCLHVAAPEAVAVDVNMKVEDALDRLTRELRGANERLQYSLGELDRRKKEADENARRATGESAAELLKRWARSDTLPPAEPDGTYNPSHLVAFVVAQLTDEGVPAWNGDATFCVANWFNRVLLERARAAQEVRDG